MAQRIAQGFVWLMATHRLHGVLIAMLLAAGLAGPLWAQEKERELSLGLVIMPQINGLYNPEVTRNGRQISELSYGFSGGLSVTTKLRRHLGGEIDILYASQGQNYSFKLAEGSSFNPQNISNQYSSYDLSISYVKIPVLVTYFSRVVDRLSYRLYGGPEVMLKLNVGEKINGQVIDYSGQNLTATDKFASQDIGLVVGASLDFHLYRKLTLTSGIRLEYGLQDVEKKSVSFVPAGSIGGISKPFYDTYYGVNKPRHAPSHQYVVGFQLGLSYRIENVRDPKDYRF